MNFHKATLGCTATGRVLIRGRIMRGGRLWQQREPELRAMAGTMPAQEIARHYGVTRGGLSYQASRLGISLALPPELRRRDCGGGPRRVWASRRAELPALAQQLTDHQIAAHYACELSALRARARRWGIELRRGEPAGRAVAPWKITCL
jgi:hypothetical protein